MLGWCVGLVMFVQSSFPVTFLVTLEGTRAQKLTTVVRENGDFCHPVLGFGLIVKRGKKT